MSRFVIILVLLLMFCGCSRPANSQGAEWIPVNGITVVSEPDGKTLLTSADLTQAMITVEERQRISTIWFQLTKAAARRYQPPTVGQQWTLRLNGVALASVMDQPEIGSFPNRYLFCVADMPLSDGRRISEVILIRQKDAR